ncbi:MAG: hypothetical protein HKN30_00870 [Sulfitobacter sp.]|nr:hypothetical protein [Sulfitobacter sp.]
MGRLRYSRPMFLFALSFVANIALTFSVAWAIRRDGTVIEEAYGPDSPARRILACVYVAIGLVSLYGFLQLGYGRTDIAIAVALTLFPLQIIYKVLTAIVVGFRNPVVIANLGVVWLLGATLLFAPY